MPSTRSTPGYRYERAIGSVDRGIAALLVHISICDESPSTWATARGERVEAGAPCLRLGLEALAAHYREERAEAA
jgi:hypothetical protein